MTTNHNFDILVRLPIEIGQNILSHLNGDDLWKIFKVSKAWKAIANDEFLWKKQCLLDDLDINKEPSSDAYSELCRHARIWGEWRWGAVYNWEQNLFLETKLQTEDLAPHYCIATHDRKIALSNGSEIFVYTRENSKIITLHERTFTGCFVREIQMNKDYLVVIRNTCVAVYQTEDYKPYLFCGFVTGQLCIYRDNFPTSSIVFEHSSVEFVLLYENKLWICDYLFIQSTNIVDLSTGVTKKLLFPWKCTLLRAKENVFARSNTLLGVYALSGDKSFDIECLDFSWIRTSKNVLALITDREINTFNRLSGEKIGMIKKSFIDYHTNYKKDVIYGISRAETHYSRVEAVSLLNGNVLWVTKLPGDFHPETRSLLNIFLCYDYIQSRSWYILDARTGKCLYKRRLPKDGRIIYLSDVFWVCQTQEKLIIRFY
ncbi:unnamed protein product [Nezara viridula]|uniref:F-box domain-containing protein n=1 Tax=Nezara viridula TaxID=85310 RepID=A0A9P0HD70_NEZVI|nr:unnamed protein product [Nezara viridula]